MNFSRKSIQTLGGAFIVTVLLIFSSNQDAFTISANEPTNEPTAVASIITPETTQTTIDSTNNPIVTSTIVPSSTQTESLEPSTTPTPTLEEQPIVNDPSFIFIPILFNQPTLEPSPISPDIYTFLYCKHPGFAIPDNDPNGIEDYLEINDPRFIVNIDTWINLSHTWVGDLVVQLIHQPSGTSLTLIDRPGYPENADGCNGDDIVSILDDEISSPVENKCAAFSPSIGGIYKPQQPLSEFAGETVGGTWILRVSDQSRGDVGRLNDWCLFVQASDIPLTPVPPPIMNDLPESATVGTVYGKSQAMPLDCESRSAVDWAAFYGVNIDEYDFFNNLPKSDNPDVGFVGNVFDRWGQIPPNSYGVHAEPVADLLRFYGLEAYAHRPLTWDQLRAEIAMGNPVITWVVGNVINGIPEYYQSSDGHISVVARYEHTVIVTGYDANQVKYLNGAITYSRSIEQFLDSWSALGNMAITKHP
jgi:subtilisin-like proprotein convertase family protein/uncharacterized protein YvpB